jgi:hypothetical protein
MPFKEKEGVLTLPLRELSIGSFYRHEGELEALLIIRKDGIFKDRLLIPSTTDEFRDSIISLNMQTLRLTCEHPNTNVVQVKPRGGVLHFVNKK